LFINFIKNIIIIIDVVFLFIINVFASGFLGTTQHQIKHVNILYQLIFEFVHGYQSVCRLVSTAKIREAFFSPFFWKLNPAEQTLKPIFGVMTHQLSTTSLMDPHYSFIHLILCPFEWKVALFQQLRAFKSTILIC